MKPLEDSINFTIPDDINDCWLAEGGKAPRGYLPICRSVNGAATTFYAHRVVFEIAHGPIPAGMHVMHTCDQPSCVNPDHLTVGTIRQNSHDCARKGRNTHKLSREQATEIITSPTLSTERIKEIAREAGCTAHNVRSVRYHPWTWAWLRKELGVDYEWIKKQKTYQPKGVWDVDVMSYRQKLRSGLKSQITEQERKAWAKYYAKQRKFEEQRYNNDPEYRQMKRDAATAYRERIRQENPEMYQRTLERQRLWQEKRAVSMTPEGKKLRADKMRAWRQNKAKDPAFKKKVAQYAAKDRENNLEQVRKRERRAYEKRRNDPAKVERQRELSAQWRARQKQIKQAQQENKDESK